jgi:hypothetical protein
MAMATSKGTEQVVETEGANHSPANGLAGEPPDFTAEWQQIEKDIQNEAEGALRVGQNLIKIKAALPHGMWLEALKEHGMSQPQASRYIRYARLPEADRLIFQRAKGFSLSRAVGERRSKPKAPSEAPRERVDETPISADELAARLEGVEQRVKLAIDMVNLGECELANQIADERPQEYAEDDERWQGRVSEIANDLRDLIAEGLEAVMKRRLLPGRP